MSREEDLSKLSPAEMYQRLKQLTLEKDQLTKQLQRQEQHSLKIILDLRDTNQKLSDENAILREDNRKLKIHKENVETLIENLVQYIKTHRQRAIKILGDVSLKNIFNLTRLQDFLCNVIRELISNASALNYHQARSLNLGTSEKNSPKYTPTEDEQAAEEYGRDELSQHDTDEQVQLDESDSENKDFEDNSQEFVSPAPAQENNGSTQDNTASPPEGPAHQSTEAVLADSKELLTLPEGEVDYHNEGVTKRRDHYYVSTQDCNQVAGIVTNGEQNWVDAYCHTCQCCQRFVLQKKLERFNRIIGKINTSGDIGTLLSPVYVAICPVCGETMELGPALFANPTLIQSAEHLENKPVLHEQQTDTGGAPTPSPAGEDSSAEAVPEESGTGLRLGSEQSETAPRSSRKKNKSRQRQRKAIYKQIDRDEHKITMSAGTDKLIVQDGFSVIDPWEFNAEAFSFTPAFSKSCLSVGMLASAGAFFSQIGAPKNRQFNFFQGQGFPLTREQLTSGINCFARAYYRGVADKIRQDILSQSNSIIMDESYLLVTNTAARKMAEHKGRKSQIFTLCSGWSSPIQAAWYHVADTREGEHIVDILTRGLKAEELPEFLTVDGYRGYDKAVKIINSSLNADLKITRCITHLRRPVHRWLHNNGLLEIYNDYLLPKGSKFTDFGDNLRQYLEKPKKIRLSNKERDMLIIYYLINSLFVVDSGIVLKHEFNCQSEAFLTELRAAREQRTAKLLDLLYEAVSLYITSYPECIDIKRNKDGSTSYRAKKMYLESKALIYLLNFEKDVRRVVLSPEIELSQSAAERAIKGVIYLRKNCQFLKSEDGAAAFADYQTIAHTCNLNGVPVYNYTVWLVANIRRRMLALQSVGQGDPTFFRMPQRQTLLETAEVDGKQVEQKTTIGIYDPRNVQGYDKIDFTGLTPYDYRKYLDNRGGYQRPY